MDIQEYLASVDIQGFPAIQDLVDSRGTAGSVGFLAIQEQVGSVDTADVLGIQALEHQDIVDYLDRQVMVSLWHSLTPILIVLIS